MTLYLVDHLKNIKQHQLDSSHFVTHCNITNYLKLINVCVVCLLQLRSAALYYKLAPGLSFVCTVLTSEPAVSVSDITRQTSLVV